MWDGAHFGQHQRERLSRMEQKVFFIPASSEFFKRSPGGVVGRCENKRFIAFREKEQKNKTMGDSRERQGYGHSFRIMSSMRVVRMEE